MIADLREASWSAVGSEARHRFRPPDGILWSITCYAPSTVVSPEQECALLLCHRTPRSYRD